MNILVLGGAGYIGSHTCIKLIESGHNIVVLDNSCSSQEIALSRVEKITNTVIPFVQADVRDKAKLKEVMLQHHIEAVIHFAGLKAVGESSSNPLLYYNNNVSGGIAVLEVMAELNIKKIIFSSSATVYGGPHIEPITEDYPLCVANPYGRTKLMFEDILRDLYQADNRWNISILRYFNPIGAHESGLIGEDPNGIPNNLLPYISQVAVGRRAFLSVYGDDYATKDGTGVRDYIHVCDLAAAHVAALAYLNSHDGLSTFNLGTGIGYSVLDVVKTFSEASGKNIPYQVMPRRAGDVDIYFADPSRANTLLGWTAKKSLYDMCYDTWHWQSNNPQGYV